MNKIIIQSLLLLPILLVGYLFFVKTSGAALTSGREVTFLAVGDIMLSRQVAAKINQANNPLLPFSKMAAILSSTDFNVGNLESPFSGKDSYREAASLVFNTPRANIQGLVKYNFKVLNLANNHALDQGLAGLIYTKNYLAENNIQSIGAGENLTQAWQPVIIDSQGVKFAFIGAAYASFNDNGKKKNDYVARSDDLVNLKKSIAAAKQQADLVIVNMHAGAEYKHHPDKTQISFAHAAIDNGADLVIGHHPHWVQTIEKYNSSPSHPYCKKSSWENSVVIKDGKNHQALDLGDGCEGKYIFYSLGNFIFDQMWSTATRQGMAVKFTVKKDEAINNKNPVSLARIELIPLMIDNYSTPRLAKPAEAKMIWKSISNPPLAILPPQIDSY